MKLVEGKKDKEATIALHNIKDLVFDDQKRC